MYRCKGRYEYVGLYGIEDFLGSRDIIYCIEVVVRVILGEGEGVFELKILKLRL